MVAGRYRTFQPCGVATGVPANAWDRYAREVAIELHRLRVDRGLTQERLAAMAGISTFTYQKLEKGESNPGSPANPRLRTLAELADALGVSLHELLPERSVRRRRIR